MDLARLALAAVVVALGVTSGAARAQSVVVGDAPAELLPQVDVKGETPVMPWRAGEPLTVWSPPPREARRWTLSAVGEYVYRSAQLKVDDEIVSLLDHVGGVHLSAGYAPFANVGVGVTVPLLYARGSPDGSGRVTQQVGVGDVRLTVPVAFTGAPDGTGLGLGLVPWVSVPTGTAPDLTSAGSVAGGAVAAIGYGIERAQIVASAGPTFARAGGVIDIPVRSSTTIGGGLGGSFRAGVVWLGGEVRSHGNLLRIDRQLVQPNDRLSPPALEGFLTVSTGGGTGRVVASGGTHLGINGIGAAAFRGFAGAAASGTFGAREDGPRSPDDVIPMFTFRVHDPLGPVVGAEIVAAGTNILQVTDARGEAVVPVDALKWTRGVEVRSDRHITASVAAPERGATSMDVELGWKPVPIGANVVDVDGNDVPVLLRATDDEGNVLTGEPGTLALPPGHYVVEVVPADGSGKATQRREIDVPATGDPPPPLDVVAIPGGGPAGVALRITDPEGNPVVGARVSIGGVPVGTTAEGGLIAIQGLPEGEQSVEIVHSTFTAHVSSLALTKEASETPITLERRPGSVRVRVRAAMPDGATVPVTDAHIRFIGPVRLPEMRVGSTGERTEVLTPGDWLLVVSSPAYGIQERDVIVPPNRYELLTVDVVLRPVEEQGLAELALRVVTPDGTPVEGATVLLDGADVGTTSTGGTARLAGLAPGPRTIAVAAPGLEEMRPLLVPIRPGIQDLLITARWLPGTVDVVVRGPEGPAVGAVVRFASEGSVEAPLTIGPTGRLRKTGVVPGSWTIVVTSQQFGAQERDLVVEAGDGNLAVVTFVMAPIEDGVSDLSIRVTDPSGQPVDRAEIYLDDLAVGSTANGGIARFAGLERGRRTLRVDAPMFKPYTAELELAAGDQSKEVHLDWGTGLKVRVRRSGAPVTDARVRALGPRMLPPVPVDENGQVSIELEPDFWLVVVTSPTYGVAEQDVEVRTRGVTNVDVELVPPAADATDLLVTVVDPVGGAVEQAKVFVGDTLLEQTQQGGTVLVRGVSPGETTIRIEAPDYVTTTPLPVVLQSGAEHYTVRMHWVEIPVEVRVTDADGTPMPATVQWTGPADVDPVTTGPEGRSHHVLRPGAWRVYARGGPDGGLDGTASIRLDLGDEPGPITVVLSPTGARPQGDAVVIDERVQFDFGKATLRPDSDVLLDQVARAVASQPTLVRLEVQGHTDNVGTIVVNQSLSQARADAVVAALVARGVPREILDARGYGPTRPIADNTTDEGRAENRRVQFVVAERGDEPAPPAPATPTP